MTSAWRVVASTALLAGATAIAAEPAPVEWRTGWRVGDSATYRVTQQRIDERARGAPSTRTSVSTLVVRVLPSAPGQTSGLRLGWRRTLDEGRPLAAADAERAPALAALLRQAPEVVLRADADGLPERVENVEELVTLGQRVAAELAERPAMGASAPALAALVQQLVTPSLVQSVALAEANTLLGYAGVAFTPGQTREVAQELPNPLGGPNFPAQTRVRVLEHDATARRLRIEAVTTLDPLNARAVIEKTLDGLAQRAGRALPPGTFSRVDIRTVHTIEVDLADGWPLRARSERQIDIGASDGAARRVDTHTYERR
jgi:hypothetical protein